MERERDMIIGLNEQVNLNPSFKVTPKKVALIFEGSGSQHLVKVSIIQNNHYVHILTCNRIPSASPRGEISACMTLPKFRNTYALNPFVPIIIVTLFSIGSNCINVQITHRSPDYCHFLYHWMHMQTKGGKSINNLVCESTCDMGNARPSWDNQLIFFRYWDERRWSAWL
jgi:hypothetical protein